ncbi:M28 family metallopeptidase [Reichenbachiella carrageenanivorans]|uniref:M28 family metallopeptidase n=1 Tax=Reichenbachiella carrageenanivorans TaxID=2979869 RepID=A0ABY6CW92_9BACT|nr:M28 family metallopeptidase [Reichenbachiella carrageenanivorans]UXX77979.1 M28 family metallopeptidase [Reichenbachiella carrageenanivorans]
MKKSTIVFAMVLTILGCTPKENFQEAYDSISEEGLKTRIKALASDEFLGRMPFTEGETKTINYLKGEFQKLGLKPGNDDSYFQEVPLVELTATVDPQMKIAGGDADIALNYWDDFVALTRRVTDSVRLEDSELVFAGYGTIAPEYGWNDYKELDVKGKTVVVLINDPGFGTEDKSFFKGNEMTYYGRWTYKYEEAARQGAAGIIIIHETAHASYPFEVVQGGWSGANLYLENPDNNESRCVIEGWISENSANRIFANMGMKDYNFYEEARQRTFKSFALNQRLSVGLKNKIKRSKSNNVIAKYEGSEQPNETIIYSAHWDHFGVGKPVNGDSIYNGAVDNGTGVAAIVQVAEAFAKLNVPTKRSVVFMAVTAEEQGLLGSAHYAVNPIYDPAKTVANLNVDAIRPIGRVNDFSIVGYGQSELDDYAQRAVEKQGRYITPDPHPESGGFFRSDHFNFASIGIPALYGKGATDSEANGKQWGEEQYKKYTSENYHKPSDEYSEDFNAEGVKLDAQVLFDIGYTLANESVFPKWKEGSEFKVIREGNN